MILGGHSPIRPVAIGVAIIVESEVVTRLSCRVGVIRVSVVAKGTVPSDGQCSHLECNLSSPNCIGWMQ